MTPDPLDLDAIEACAARGTAAFPGRDPHRISGGASVGDVLALTAEVRRLRAEVARLRSVGEDDIATWAEYVTGKKWAPVEAGPNG